jgi:thiamine monophosphate synthase
MNANRLKLRLVSKFVQTGQRQSCSFFGNDNLAIARAKSLVVAKRGHVDMSVEEAREIIAEHEANKK